MLHKMLFTQYPSLVQQRAFKHFGAFKDPHTRDQSEIVIVAVINQLFHHFFDTINRSNYGNY